MIPMYGGNSKKQTQWAKAIVVDKYNIFIKKRGRRMANKNICKKNQQKQLQEKVIKYDG